MIRTILFVVVALVAALLIAAAMRPDTFRVQRSVQIKAPPARVQPLIADMRQFNTWNPFNKKDPAMKGTYRGPSSGPGQAFDFDGGKNVGKGSLEITGVQADQVAMKLDMIAPMEGHNTIAFTLVPRGDATEVTWAMQGPQPFIGKLMGLVFNLDRMIGGDFENGLADLKTLAEKS